MRYLTGVDRGKVFRWAISLSQFDSEIVYITGDSNNMADWLSRYENISWRVLAVLEFKLVNLPVMASKEDFEKATYPPEGVKGLIECGKLWIQADTGKVYVPYDIRQRLMINFHSGSSGHLGVTKTSNRIKKLFYWPGLKEDVAKMIRECLICTRQKRLPPGNRGSPI